MSQTVIVGSVASNIAVEYRVGESITDVIKRAQEKEKREKGATAITLSSSEITVAYRATPRRVLSVENAQQTTMTGEETLIRTASLKGKGN